ncbi:MAG: 16S rRNA (cytidine(1402)-2'-O)-methyltransferase [Acidiferrobacterales bacterium]|nr:16S rRNA (cytidine(1402)-2'-O)-methyltransferase [Acidiferrobacterales bacterium]
MVSNQAGNLYIVATPIGNLGDMTQRAIDVLRDVDLVAAEDTRHSQKLLTHFGINQRLVSCHEHNEEKQVTRFLELLEKGQSIALLSDAGTPLVSDPGYRIVSAAAENGYRIIPVPGACAAIAALSVSGLATDRFLFAGFPSAKQAACKKQLEALAPEPATLVFYESPRRLVATLQTAQEVFGPDRHTVIARELTKLHESIARGRLQDVLATVQGDTNWERGEIVLLFAGHTEVTGTDSERREQIEKVLKPLLQELPLKQAVSLTVKITGARKNEVYDLAIAEKGE